MSEPVSVDCAQVDINALCEKMNCKPSARQCYDRQLLYGRPAVTQGGNMSEPVSVDCAQVDINALCEKMRVAAFDLDGTDRQLLYGRPAVTQGGNMSEPVSVDCAQVDINALCEKMRVAAFDLDGTLARSKKPMHPDMAQALSTLTTLMPVAIISGGAMPLLESQVTDVLTDDADRHLGWRHAAAGKPGHRRAHRRCRPHAPPSHAHDRHPLFPVVRRGMDPHLPA